MPNFELSSFMHDTNLIAKHPEIYKSGKTKEIKKYNDIFEKYTKYANKENNITKLINKLKKDYDAQDQVVDKIGDQVWNMHYLKYDVPDETNKKLNDMYIFPHNTEGRKLKSKLNFFINCIGLRDATNLRLINRNGHMVITGDGSEHITLGINVTYKMLILYNYKYKKWIIAPFKMVSTPPKGVRCDSFARSATTNNVNEQYNIWKVGLKRHKGNLGVVNFKYTDDKFKNLPNLFTPNQTNYLLTEAKRINMRLGGRSRKKPSRKKTSRKKTSRKKTSRKKTSRKKTSRKKK
jgi:hypothetical protein